MHERESSDKYVCLEDYKAVEETCERQGKEILKLMKKLNKSRKQTNTVRKALEVALEHLEYCGYGDSYERECAKEAKLPEMINRALEMTSKDNDNAKTIGDTRNSEG